MIRVLYDISPLVVGGTEHFLARLIEALDRRRFAPLVVARQEGPTVRLMRSLGVPVVTIHGYDSALGARRIVDVIREHRVDIAQSNYYSSQLALAANLAGVPHVWRPGGHVKWGAGAASAHDRSVALELMELLSAEIICNSRFVRGQFANRCKTRVEVIPNGVRLSRPPRRQDSRPIRVGLVAHFTPQKRHLDFVAAAKRVARTCGHVSFAIVGRETPDPVSRRYAARVRDAAQPLVDEGRLIFAEALSPDAAVRDVDVLVLTSIGESCSNAILEGMARGLPTVAARSGGNPELLEHGRTGLLVTPARPAELADALLHLIADRRRMRAMGRAARERVARRFDVDVCARRYQDVYARVLLGQAPSRAAGRAGAPASSS